MGESTEPKIAGRLFVEAMTLAVRQAMAAARWLKGRVPNRPKLEEFTPEKAALTDADCVAQEILLVALHEHFPRVAVVVEEDTPSAAQFRRQRSRNTVVIDPIDGTLLYLRGEARYAVLVGLEVDGRVEASIVGLPESQTLVRAVRGEGAEISHTGGPFRRARVVGEGRLLLVSTGMAPELRARLKALGHEIAFGAGAAIGIAPLVEKGSAIRVSTAEEGLSRRAWISTLPTLEAGGAVEALDGPFPEQCRPGVRGMIVGPSSEAVRRVREAVL
jgi:fructose-1,6-bisphosphatase/inositol monophosphatase family enzyme